MNRPPDANQRRRFRAFVHLPRHLNADEYRARFEQGLEPEETPYGFHLAEKFDVDVVFSDKPSLPLSTFYRIVMRLIGFDPVNAWRNREAMRSADVIWTMLEADIAGAAALMALGIVPEKPIIGSTVWAAHRWPKIGRFRRALFGALLRRAAGLFVHSERCLAPLREIAPDVPVRLLHFGVSTSQPGGSDLLSARKAGGPLRIVAAGNDDTRDWQTLIAAFGSDDRFELKIACRWLDHDVAKAHPNVEICKLAGAGSLLALYRSADYLVVPMFDNLYSGITAALEAAILEKPLVSSRTGGVTTYFSDDEVIYVPVGDPVAMREAVAGSLERARQIAKLAKERFVACDYSSQGMMGRYAEATRELLPI